MKRRVLGSLLVGAVATAVPAGCGSPEEAPPLLGSSPLQDSGLAADASLAPLQPTCAELSGMACGCTDVSPIGPQPTLYFVLDNSSSMADDSKWNTVRSVVGQITEKIGARAYFGVALLPGPDGATTYCQTGGEVYPPTLGDTIATADGGTTAAIQAALDRTPNGSTPTAATLAALTPELTARTGPTYVILATDGGPNCADVASCDAADCTTNVESDGSCSPSGPTCCVSSNDTARFCVDQDGAVAAVQALAAVHIPTYVVGITSLPRYVEVLDAMAQAGGTARSSEPYFYDATTDDSAAIEAALLQVTADIVGSCTVTLDQAPADPALVNVLLDGTPLAADPANGWSLAGTTITLSGTACQSVTSGQVLDVRVIVGCPTTVVR